MKAKMTVAASITPEYMKNELNNDMGISAIAAFMSVPNARMM